MNAVAREGWGSRMGLILAMAGNAVGLGNFLRFPVQAVQNGGGAFILPYLVSFFLLGIPLLWVEWASGRLGGRFGFHSPPFILGTMSKRPMWKYLGVVGIFTNLAIAAYYSYIESWTLSYSLRSISGWFHGRSEQFILGYFDNYISLNTSFLGLQGEALLFFVICVIINTLILSKGLAGIEKMAKIGMPLLIVFAIFLVVIGLTHKSGSGANTYHPWEGVNYLWTPQFDSIWRPKVWLAAAGQIFFTLSVGMGTIHCYASYLKANDDVALNAVSAGFTNEFVEIVLGSMIVVPIAAGFLGLDWMKEHLSFGAAFQTMPYLFDQWGPVLGAVSGFFWFGLLFFAGITSSLAMGMPWISFLKDHFGWKQKQAALSFGFLVLILGLPTVLFYKQGVFSEYDYWAGTVGLVIFALGEIILFSWVFGIDKGWKELNRGAEIRIPRIYRFILVYVTPALLILVLIGAVITPHDNNWLEAFRSLLAGDGWQFDNSSMVNQLLNTSLKEQIKLADSVQKVELERKMLYINGSRWLLLSIFAVISGMLFLAIRRIKQNTR